MKAKGINDLNITLEEKDGKKTPRKIQYAKVSQNCRIALKHSREIKYFELICKVLYLEFLEIKKLIETDTDDEITSKFSFSLMH